MERRVWAGLLLVAILSISALWLLGSHGVQHSGGGFRIYSVGNNATLISDTDILSYNWTSQEMAITHQASERLAGIGDLYSWTGFAITIDGEEVYRGVFREYTMSAIPAPPRISIVFPSVLFPSQSTNDGAIRMFFPGFQPPGDQEASNAKILQYFQKTGRLVY